MVTPPAAMPSCTISFCIPTYNRADTVHALVMRVLQCPARDIEVVVLDNGSSDDTVDRLNTITDERLTVRSNGTNRGVLFNVVNVLLQGRGDYSVLLLDKDSVDPARIPAFKEFLQRERVACGFCEYDSAPGRQAEVVERGLPAIQRIGYTCHHPTGYFFDTGQLRELNIDKRYVEYDYVGHFPFEFIQAELALKGPVAVYHAPVFAAEELQLATSTKSFGTNAAKEDAFFSPNGRLKMAVNFSRQIKALPLPMQAKRQLVQDRFAHGLLAATWNYRALLRNEAICSHYHIPTRAPSLWEIVSIGWRFHRSFVRQVVNAKDFEGLRLSGARLAGDFVARMARSLKRRLSRRLA